MITFRRLKRRGHSFIVTIPKEIIIGLGWKPQDFLAFWVDTSDAVYIRRVRDEDAHKLLAYHEDDIIT